MSAENPKSAENSTEENVPEVQPVNEALKERSDAALSFLKSYKKPNEEKLDEDQKTELKEALKNINENVEPAEKIIEKIIKGRTEVIKEALDSKKVIKYADADSRILGYIDDETIKNMPEVFKDYLDAVEHIIKSDDEKDGVKELKEKIEGLEKNKKQSTNVLENSEEEKPENKPDASDTVVGLQKEAEDTKIEKKEEAAKVENNVENNDKEPEWLPPEDIPDYPDKVENPMITLNNLIEQKRKIESSLSQEGLPEKEKEKLLADKKAKSLEIIENGCQVIKKDFDAEKKQMDLEKETQWQRYIETFGGHKKYMEWEQYMLFNNKEALNSRYEEIIKNSSLTEKQKNVYLNPKRKNTGEINFGGLYGINGIILNKEDSAVLLQAGVDVTKIKRNWFGLGNKIIIGEQKFSDLTEFNNFILSTKQEYIKKESEKRSEQRKKLTIDQSIEQFVFDREILKIKGEILEKQEREKNEREEKRKQENIEVAKNLTSKEKLSLINEIRKNWAKAENIHKFLKKGKGNIKTEDGRVLKVGEDNEEIEKLKENYSTEVVKYANKISGLDLMKECSKTVGYDLKAEPKNLEKQKEFRTLLTKKIEEIFSDKVKEVEKASGKKIRAKKVGLKSALLLLANELDEAKMHPGMGKSNIPDVQETPRAGVITRERLKPINGQSF